MPQTHATLMMRGQIGTTIVSTIGGTIATYVLHTIILPCIALPVTDVLEQK